MNQNYLKYIQIKEQTYDVFEIYHNEALANLFKENISAKDLSLLKLSHALKEATPTKIINATKISPTNLSNRLAHLETQGLLERSKNVSDQRQRNIKLTKKALLIIKDYQIYFDGLVTYLKRGLNIQEKIAFNRYLQTWSKNISELNQAGNAINSNVIDKMLNFFLSNETTFFEDETITFNYHELSFLCELYLNEKITHLSLPTLAAKLFLPYQTVVSKVNRLIQEGVISKDKKKLTFSDKSVHAIDQFIMLRVFTYYQVLLGATKKEVDVVTKVFALFKEYALSIINK